MTCVAELKVGKSLFLSHKQVFEDDFRRQGIDGLVDLIPQCSSEKEVVPFHRHLARSAWLDMT